MRMRMDDTHGWLMMKMMIIYQDLEDGRYSRVADVCHLRHQCHQHDHHHHHHLSGSGGWPIIKGCWWWSSWSSLSSTWSSSIIIYQDLEDGRYSRVADLTESVAKCDVGCLYTRDQVHPVYNEWLWRWWMMMNDFTQGRMSLENEKILYPHFLLRSISPLLPQDLREACLCDQLPENSSIVWEAAKYTTTCSTGQGERNTKKYKI